MPYVPIHGCGGSREIGPCRPAAGHGGCSTVLFRKFLKFDPADPAWADRDRFVLSAGHGSMLIYSLLHLTGYKSVSRDDIRNFRQLGAKTPGHPENFHTPGVETTTGPLGQGIATLSAWPLPNVTSTPASAMIWWTTTPGSSLATAA